MNASEIQKRLSAFFEEHEIQWRIGRAGMSGDRLWAKALAYVDARAVENRLDEVVGALCWSTQYTEIHNKEELVGWKCALTVEIEKNYCTKENGADLTDFEGFKGGISKAFVRAASAWGIGRYLYDLPESFVEQIETKKPAKPSEWLHQPAGRNTPEFWWKAPKLPKEFLPARKEAQQEKPKTQHVETTGERKGTEEYKAGDVQPSLSLDPLRELLTISRQRGWTPVQVNHYVMGRFKKESARLLTNEEIVQVIDVVKRSTPDNALQGA